MGATCWYTCREVLRTQDSLVTVHVNAAAGSSEPSGADMVAWSEACREVRRRYKNLLDPAV